MATVGIQGGKGSFNHQGWSEYAVRKGYTDYDVAYLYTTKQVLEALEKGKVDMAHFAIFNSIAGLVEETERELGHFRFNIIDWYRYPIAHFLMKKKGVSQDSLTYIAGHPQVFKQCTQSLAQKFPQLACVVDETGIRIDHARLAEELAHGEMDERVAIIGPSMLADLYDLEIIGEHLEDDPTNKTAFVVAERY